VFRVMLVNVPSVLLPQPSRTPALVNAGGLGPEAISANEIPPRSSRTINKGDEDCHKVPLLPVAEAASS